MDSHLHQERSYKDYKSNHKDNNNNNNNDDYKDEDNYNKSLQRIFYREKKSSNFVK